MENTNIKILHKRKIKINKEFEEIIKAIEYESKKDKNFKSIFHLPFMILEDCDEYIINRIRTITCEIENEKETN